MKKIILFALLFSISSIFSQTGNIRGTVFDNSTGESLPGVRVMVKNQKKGGYTDLDGKFNISINSGTYTLIFTMTSFDTIYVNNIAVSKEKFL